MAARGGGGSAHPPPRSDRNDDPMPPPPAAAEAGSISTGLAKAEAGAGAPPSSPAKVCIVTLHPDNEIATVMMDEEGGGLSATMVTADDDGERGDHRPSHRRWRLEVILPSSALPPSCNGGGLRGPQKPITSPANAVANAVASARWAAVGAMASRGRKTKAEAETTTATTRTTWTARTARMTLASAISHRQGGFNNQQGQEAATESSGVGADGRTMMQQWLQRTTTAGAAAVAQAAAVGGLRLSSPPPPS